MHDYYVLRVYLIILVVLLLKYLFLTITVVWYCTSIIKMFLLFFNWNLITILLYGAVINSKFVISMMNEEIVVVLLTSTSQ